MNGARAGRRGGRTFRFDIETLEGDEIVLRAGARRRR